jgi:hypothetical protein
MIKLLKSVQIELNYIQILKLKSNSLNGTQIQLNWIELNKILFSFGFNRVIVVIEISIKLNMLEFDQMELN